MNQVESRLNKLNSLLLLLYAFSLPISLTFSWAVLIVGLVAFVMSAAVRARQEGGAVLRPLAAPLALPIALLLAAVVTSGMAAGGPGEAWRSLWTFKPLIVYFWAAALFSESRELIFPSLAVVLTVSAVSGFWAMVQQLTGLHPFGYQYLQGTGFLTAPMAFAGQMQLFALMALALLLKRGFSGLPNKFAHPAVFVPVVAGNVAGVIFASERSAWLGAVAGVVVVAALVSWRMLGKCLIALTVLCALCWFTVPVVQKRLAPLADWQQDVSARVRVKLWTESLELWKSAPLTGVGICRFPHFDIPEAIVPGRSKDINHAHSNYVHILATTGAIGLATYIFLWGAALSLMLRAYRIATAAGSPDAAITLGVFGGTVALLVSGIFEYNFGTAQVRLAQWFLLAMLPSSPSGMSAK